MTQPFILLSALSIAAFLNQAHAADLRASPPPPSPAYDFSIHGRILSSIGPVAYRVCSRKSPANAVFMWDPTDPTIYAEAFQSCRDIRIARQLAVRQKPMYGGYPESLLQGTFQLLPVRAKRPSHRRL